MITRTIVQAIVGIGSVFLAATHWFPLGVHMLELVGAFAHFTLVLSAMIALIGLWKRLWLLFFCGSLSLLLSGTLVIPEMMPAQLSEMEPQFRVGQFNLYHHNNDFQNAIRVLQKSQCDVLSIQELGTDRVDELKSALAENYPYAILVPWDSCCYGIAVFSKFPIATYHVLDLDDTPTIVAQILVGEEELTMVSLHTRPPAFPNETKARNRQLETVADIISHESGACLVIGDLNVVPWDAAFKEFLKKGKLKAVRNGFQATFPMDLGFPLIPIDHITHSGNLIPTSCEAVTIPRSDHRGIVAGFTFKD